MATLKGKWLGKYSRPTDPMGMFSMSDVNICHLKVISPAILHIRSG